jgi:hypothetical protein
MSGFASGQGRKRAKSYGCGQNFSADHYSHARLYWKSLTESEQARVVSAFTFELSKVQLEQVPPRMVGNLRNVDEELAKRVADGIGIPLPETNPARAKVHDMPPSPALSIQQHMKATLEGWTVGILIADGSSPIAVPHFGCSGFLSDRILVLRQFPLLSHHQSENEDKRDQTTVSDAGTCGSPNLRKSRAGGASMKVSRTGTASGMNTALAK